MTESAMNVATNGHPNGTTTFTARGVTITVIQVDEISAVGPALSDAVQAAIVEGNKVVHLKLFDTIAYGFKKWLKAKFSDKPKGDDKPKA